MPAMSRSNAPQGTQQGHAPLLERLRAITGDAGVLTGDAVTSRAAGAFRQDGLQALAIVRPCSTEEVSAVLALCTAVRQPVVVQGGLTGLVRGCDAAGHELILSLERMNRLEALDPLGRTATVQAGMVLQHLQDAAQDAGLYYGVDHGARASATIGGGIATNAGGNRVIRYGMTRASVLGLEAVLADGTVVSSMNAMLKNNTAYDLKQLFIGSEGTLGVVTRAVLRLHPRPSGLSTALLVCDSFTQVQALLAHLDQRLNAGLLAFEAMWQDYFDLVTKPPAPSRRPFAAPVPYAVLVEAADDTGAKDDAQAGHFANVLETALLEGLASDAVIAQTLEQREAFWRIRDSVEEMKRHEPVHHFDVSLPLADMEGYVGGIQHAVRGRWPDGRCWVFGHVGDGNLHVSIAPGRSPSTTATGTTGAADRQAIESIVYGPLGPLRGAVSAEHGIGMAKQQWLAVSRSREEIALMHGIKQLLDPLHILNPGRVLPRPSQLSAKEDPSHA